MSHRGIKEQLWPFAAWFLLFFFALLAVDFAVIWFLPLPVHPFWIVALGIAAEGIVASVLAFRLSERRPPRGFDVIAPDDSHSATG
jgi:hypothetical protein